MVEWGSHAFGKARTERMLRRIRRDLRADAVTIPVVWSQRDTEAVGVGPGRDTARTARLRSAMRAARRRGLRVVLRPYVDVRGGAWRGHIKPHDVERWFASYRNFVLRFARLAREEKASGFIVGSELKTMSGYEVRWRGLVRQVRRSFRGWIAYQANWDEVEAVTWWDAVDAISVSAYHPLAREADWTGASLEAGWRHYVGGGGQVRTWFDDLRNLVATYRRPLLFGEVGYVPDRSNAMRPWSLTAATAIDGAAQAQAYEAMLRTWFRQPWFRGLHPWYLSPERPEPQAGDHRLTKDAERVLRRWYARSRRP